MVMYITYQYFRETAGWGREGFTKEVSNAFLSDEPIEIADSSIFSNLNSYVSSKECSCLYDESSKKLKKRVQNGDYYSYPDSRFTCFVYNCLRKGIILAYIEGQLLYQEKIGIDADR